MASDSNGLQQSPFDQAACPTPTASGGGGGTGGGFDLGSGANGLTQSPFDQAIVPTPGGDSTPVSAFGSFDPFPSVADAPAPNTSSASDITQPPLVTIDKK